MTLSIASLMIMVNYFYYEKKKVWRIASLIIK